MEELIDLNLIDPNPWQSRERENAEHVFKIADSIAMHGLLQVPVGRRVGNRVQLALGHTRLAAFRLLASKRMDAGFRHMPVMIRELSDIEMFEMSITENLARKDLTPIEEAKAMIRYREDFSKTSEEIGALFHLSDSAVRNKMRLLKLPANLQDALRRGELSEGSARELLALIELPEDVRMAAEDQEEYVRPSVIIEAALSGSSQKAIADMVQKFMEHIGSRPARPAPKAEPAPAWVPPSTAKESAQVFDAAPAPTHTFPAREPSFEDAPKPAPAPAPQPAPAPTPAPTPTPEERAQAAATPSTWAGSSIAVTLTLWPEDGSEDGRMVVVGVRLNQEAPVMRMYRESQIVLPEQLRDLLEDVKTKFGLGG